MRISKTQFERPLPTVNFVLRRLNSPGEFVLDTVQHRFLSRRFSDPDSSTKWENGWVYSLASRPRAPGHRPPTGRGRGVLARSSFAVRQFSADKKMPNHSRPDPPSYRAGYYFRPFSRHLKLGRRTFSGRQKGRV